MSRRRNLPGGDLRRASTCDLAPARVTPGHAASRAVEQLRGVVRSSAPQAAWHQQALLTVLSSSSPPFREPLRRAEGSRPFIAPVWAVIAIAPPGCPCSAGRRGCRLRVGPGASVGGIEHRHLCLVHGPGRIVQRVGRVILRQFGVVLGRTCQLASA